MRGAQHTPGPWWTTDSGVRDRGGFICHTNSVQRYADQDERYVFEVAQREADKHLIAAAPEVLAALRELHRVCASMDLEHEANRPTEAEYIEAMEAAEAAIAKATGSTHV